MVWGKESMGEILSMNYLLYGSREYHTQQAVQLNRIFHESFLSFGGCWRERLHVWVPGRTTAAFLKHWTTDNPREPGPSVTSIQTKYQVGLNLGPDVASSTRSPRPSLSSPKPQLHNLHPSHIQQRGFQHNQSQVFSPPPSSTSSSSM